MYDLPDSAAVIGLVAAEIQRAAVMDQRSRGGHWSRILKKYSTSSAESSGRSVQ